MNKLIKSEVNIFIACCYLSCAKQYTEAARSAHCNYHGIAEVSRLVSLSDLMVTISESYELRSRAA